MKLLVTGGYGFIGSNFILKLLEEHQEYKIKNVDAELNGSNPKNLSKIENHKNYEFVKGDITDYKLMKKLIDECDLVINFAAESFVDRSINDASPFLTSNILGTHTILDIITKEKKNPRSANTPRRFSLRLPLRCSCAPSLFRPLKFHQARWRRRSSSAITFW